MSECNRYLNQIKINELPEIPLQNILILLIALNLFCFPANVYAASELIIDSISAIPPEFKELKTPNGSTVKVEIKYVQGDSIVVLTNNSSTPVLVIYRFGNDKWLRYEIRPLGKLSIQNNSRTCITVRDPKPINPKAN